MRDEYFRSLSRDVVTRSSRDVVTGSRELNIMHSSSDRNC